jgi:hypothetical protein
MKKHTIAALLLFQLVNLNLFSQDTATTTIDNSTYIAKETGFHFGLTIGALFANQSTAQLYDGYGFDIDGNRNSYDNSFMNEKINKQYGGGAYAGQGDQIATELKVDPNTWTFSQENMPINMRYQPAFVVGLTVRYSVDKKNSILFNLNAAKLTIAGNFNIRTPVSSSGSTNQTNNNSLQTFSIKGGEQRLLIQLGYQHLMGENEKFNFLVEGGLHATVAKFDKNEIQINNLNIDLTSYYNEPRYAAALPFKRPTGIAFGAFAGMGIHLKMNPKSIIQAVYSPSYEKINIGNTTQYKFQNAICLRMYYNI